MKLPPLPSRVEVHRRLQLIFPEGTPHRNFCIREMAASTTFVMLYIGAVEGSGRYLGPKHVYRMSDEQAEMTSDDERLDYAKEVLIPGYSPSFRTWYADNTREPIRDETLRRGLIAVGAATERSLPTTSPRPRYALTSGFAELFQPDLDGKALIAAITIWQKSNLTIEALRRIEILRHSAAVRPDEDVLVTFPNGET